MCIERRQQSNCAQMCLTLCAVFYSWFRGLQHPMGCCMMFLSFLIVFWRVMVLFRLPHEPLAPLRVARRCRAKHCNCNCNCMCDQTESSRSAMSWCCTCMRFFDTPHLHSPWESPWVVAAPGCPVNSSLLGSHMLWLSGNSCNSVIPKQTCQVRHLNPRFKQWLCTSPAHQPYMGCLQDI